MLKFKDGEFELDVNVSPEEDAVWLTQEEIAILFEKDRSVITKHINNIFKENELEKMAVSAKNARTGPDGKKELVEIATVAKSAIVQIEGKADKNNSVQKMHSIGSGQPALIQKEKTYG